MLVQYVRHPANPTQLIGCVVAIDEDNIGWSQCHPSDTFIKKRARQIAYGRACRGSKDKPACYRTRTIVMPDSGEIEPDANGTIKLPIKTQILRPIEDAIEVMRIRAGKFYGKVAEPVTVGADPA